MIKTTDIFTTLLVIFVALILGLAVFYIRGELNKFNPDEDVCEMWIGGCINKGYKVEYMEWSDEFECCSKDMCFPLDNICNKWRPKTKCELDPNDEDCVCDEYKEEIVWYNPIWRIEIFKTEEELLRNISICDEVSYWIRYNGEFKYFDYSDKPLIDWMLENGATIIDIKCKWEDDEPLIDKTCIKAHEKNECEKGNEDYILEEGFYCNDKLLTTKKPIDNETITFEAECKVINKDDIGVVFEWKQICRKKTIRDLSCDELKDYYLNGIPMRCVNKQFGLCGSLTKSIEATNNELIMEYIDRCGGNLELD